MSARAQRLLPAALLLVLVMVTYAGVVSCGYIWDDDSYVTRNPLLRSLDGLRLIWFDPFSSPQYYPLVHTTYWIEFRLWNLHAAGYHVVNVLLHGLAAILLWRVLHRLRAPGAWIAAAIFAIHPIQVESVAWITERKNVLSAVFYFGSALAYLRYRDLADRGVADVSARRRMWWIALILFVSALLSKTVTSTLPAALLLLVWWKQGRIRKTDIVPLLPFFVLGMSLGLTTAWLERDLVGAAGSAWDLNILERCLLAGRILCFYVGKLLWPHPLSFVYERWNVDAGQWWQYTFPIISAGALLALWMARSRLGRGPFVGAAIYAGTLFPSLGFFNVYPMRFSWVADHFQYHASAALIALLVGAAMHSVNRVSKVPAWDRLSRRAPKSGGLGKRVASRPPTTTLDRKGLGGFQRGPGMILSAFFGLLMFLSWQQIPQYRDAAALWQSTRERNPKAWLATYSLGEIRRGEGRIAEAKALYEETLALRPDLGIVHTAFGLLAAAEGQLNRAVDSYREAIRLDPNETTALLQLASIYAGEDPDWQNPPEAIRLAERASQITKDRNPWILSTLTVAYARAGRLEDAARTAERARDRALLAGDRTLADTNAARLAQLRQFLDNPGKN